MKKSFLILFLTLFSFACSKKVDEGILKAKVNNQSLHALLQHPEKSYSTGFCGITLQERKDILSFKNQKEDNLRFDIVGFSKEKWSNLHHTLKNSIDKVESDVSYCRSAQILSIKYLHYTQQFSDKEMSKLGEPFWQAMQYHVDKLIERENNDWSMLAISYEKLYKHISYAKQQQYRKYIEDGALQEKPKGEKLYNSSLGELNDDNDPGFQKRSIRNAGETILSKIDIATKILEKLK